MAALIRKNWFQVLAIVLLAFIGVALGAEMFARPGGGSSFGGGGGGGGGSFGGGGGGGGGDGGFIIYMIIRYPHISIPILILFVAFRIYMSRKAPKDFVASDANGRTHKIARAQALNAQLEAYKNQDPNFSQTLFLDFTQHLYYQVHHTRSKPEFHNLRPYFDQHLMENLIELNERSRVDVSELVIGSVDYVSFQQNEHYDIISLDFDANYTETRQGHSNRLMVLERWSFRRRRGVQSRGPEDMETLTCPNCGSGLELTSTGACKSCSQIVEPGEKHWEIISISTLRRQVQPAQQFGHYEPERGTTLPTIYDPNLQARLQIFAQQHNIPDFSSYWEPLEKNVIIPIFKKVYEAWEEQNWEKARPLMTDFLFMSQRYWMDAYRAAGVVNKLDDLQINRVELAKADLDKYFETFTVRIQAAVKDYAVNKSGKVIGGKPNTLRHFSEYWTFVRRTGVEAAPTEYKADACPNCGAPVKMGQTGICGYCDTKVTTGEFNWILSRITQDEVYYG